MENDIIDAEYRIVEEKQNGKIEVNADPTATIISGMFDIVKESMRCHKEYKMLKEEQRTEREKIKVEYKILHEKISVRHEQLMTIIKNSHNEKMEQLRHRHEIEKKVVDNFQMLVNKTAAEGKYEEMRALLAVQLNYLNQFQSENATLIGQSGMSPELLLGWKPDEVKYLPGEMKE